MAVIKADERYMILEEDKNGILLTENDITENTVYLIDGRSYRILRNGITSHLILDKTEELPTIKYGGKIETLGGNSEYLKSDEQIEKMINPNSSVQDRSYNCSLCQNLCLSCKCICVTCKAPCRNCITRSVNNCYTDTDDFDRYLESLSRKVKIPSKVKTIGVDTCDLDAHFDYYKCEKSSVVKKSIGTDCSDLTVRKPAVKKVTKKAVSVDTSDLDSMNVKESPNESDCEFFWSNDNEPKTYLKKTTEKPDIKEELVEKVTEESFKEDDEKAVKIETTVDFDASTSDESDVDLKTSTRVSKSRKLAKEHNLTLTEVKVKNDVNFECSVCKESFKRKYLGILHLEKHVSEFNCTNCDIKFDSLELLFNHEKTVHSERLVNQNINKTIKCGVCDKKFSSKSKMLSHQRFHKRKDKSFQCSLCPAEESSHTFLSYKALYVHKRLKHGILNAKEGDGEKKVRMKREFVCLFCGKEFKSNKALNDHSPVHTGEKNYLCDICNKSYTTNANLQIHKRTHTGLKNFKCTLCDKAFHKKDSLKVHFRKHSGERPFQCDLCPMKFDRNYILKNHRLRHFSEKRYICPVCGKAFTTHGGLNNHEKSHNKDPGQKKPRKPAVKPTLDTENAVICDVCGKVYSTRSNLRVHKLVHLGVKPFQCPVCHQSYAKKDSMLTHMRKHTDERPFACETCGMTFYRNHTLKTHRLRHTGERPHKCNMCGKSFTQSSSLAYHIKHHDRKEEKKKVLLSDDATKLQKKKRIVVKPQIPVKKSLKKEEPKNPELPTGIIIMKDDAQVLVPEKDSSFSKGGHFMLPIDNKEVLILDRNLGFDPNKPPNKDIEFFNMEKESPNKFSYYIAKSHVFSLPKDKPKTLFKKDESYSENLIVSKNSFITKDGTLVTTREMPLKTDKIHYMESNESRLEIKAENILPVPGEILNATFITDENNEMIPYTSMALQTINAENVIINPLLPIETEDPEKRRILFRTKTDVKLKPNTVIGKNLSDKLSKGSNIVPTLKDTRSASRIQIVSPGSAPVQIQVPCSAIMDEGMLQTISGTYYSNIQSSQL